MIIEVKACKQTGKKTKKQFLEMFYKISWEIYFIRVFLVEIFFFACIFCL